MIAALKRLFRRVPTKPTAADAQLALDALCGCGYVVRRRHGRYVLVRTDGQRRPRRGKSTTTGSAARPTLRQV
jgi:hypothetical protein